MFEVGVYEAKTHLPSIIKRVRRGEECTITYRGEPVVTMQPVKRKKKDVAMAWREIREYAKKNRINATLEEMIAWKNEGRP